MKRTRKPKRLEAWAVVFTNGRRGWFTSARDAAKWQELNDEDGGRIVYLAEADHSAAAELKALRRVAKAAAKWQSMVLKEGERATVTSALAYCAQLKRLHDAVLALSQRKGRKP